jgi:hypothetical protein
MKMGHFIEKRDSQLERDNYPICLDHWPTDAYWGSSFIFIQPAHVDKSPQYAFVLHSQKMASLISLFRRYDLFGQPSICE